MINLKRQALERKEQSARLKRLTDAYVRLRLENVRAGMHKQDPEDVERVLGELRERYERQP